MNLRRRRATVTDLEAARAARNANGAYDESGERDQRIAARSAADFLRDPMLSTRLIEEFKANKPRFGNHPTSHSPASSAVGEHRAPLSAVQSSVDGGAPPNLDDKRRQEREAVWARRDAQSIAEACAEIDRLHEAVEQWASDFRFMQGRYLNQARENDRLRSELNQALAQLRIAREQRDEFRARLDWETNGK